MTVAEVMEQLRHLSNAERLAVIEETSRLIREELQTPLRVSREEKSRRLRAAAEALKDLYEPGGELTEWTALDAEDFLDDTVPR
jgi:hypothetical protein